MTSQDNIQIRFLGAAGRVTGSKHLLTLGLHNILIDCGLFQGEDEKLNNEPFAVEPGTIHCVLLTHAHLDHTGYLPALTKHHFKGKIYGTAPTLQIAEIILNDSAKIMEEELKQHDPKKRVPSKKRLEDTANEHFQYTIEEVSAVTELFSAVALDQWTYITDDISFRYRYNGHIVGACFVEIRFKDKWLVFSGDIGRQSDFLLYPPQKPGRADILVVESTYGDRLHPQDTSQRLAACINRAVVKGGTIIIPSFAVERSQMLMYLLWHMKISREIPDLPVYMDSPMGKNVLEIFHRNAEWHKLPPEECTRMCDSIRRVQSIKETYAVIDNEEPKIVIAGSGMVTGGRVLTYLQHYIENPSTTILLAGYQANGTNGRLLQDGATELIIRDEVYKIKASVEMIEGLSGHADQSELLDWLSGLKNKPEKIFIVHGEPKAAETLCSKIKERYDWDTEIPGLMDTVKL